MAIHNPNTTDQLLQRILEVLPYAVIDEDLEGQIIIYTGLKEEDNKLTKFD